MSALQRRRTEYARASKHRQTRNKTLSVVVGGITGVLLGLLLVRYYL